MAVRTSSERLWHRTRKRRGSTARRGTVIGPKNTRKISTIKNQLPTRKNEPASMVLLPVSGENVTDCGFGHSFVTVAPTPDSPQPLSLWRFHGDKDGNRTV